MKKGKEAGVIPEFTVNSNGVTIKKCCASCAHKTLHDTEGPKRKCTYGDCGKIVDKSDLCKNWLISDAIDKIILRGIENKRRR